MLSSREYLRAAAQRFEAASYLQESGHHNLDAYYPAGYTIEFALKALILHATPASRRKATYAEISQGDKMHRYEVLMSLLVDSGVRIDADLSRRIRTSAWSTRLRYDSGRRDDVQTRDFVRTAGMFLDWAGRHIS